MKYEEMTKRFRQYFELPHTPVAVKFNAQRDPNVTSPLRYCEMVRKSASLGETFTATIDDISCASAELALGFTEPKYGEVYPTLIPADTKQITISPLNKCDFEPDAVVVIGNASKLMKVASTLSRVRGEIVSSKFKGEFAVCGECTAIPVMENTVNLSLLCAGARMFSGYTKDELVFGFPMEKFVELAESLKDESITKALCGCLMDDLPAQVVNSILSFGFTKGTDHFSGRFEDEIIRLYIPKDERGKSSSVALHVPVKLKDAKAAEGAQKVASEMFEDPMLSRRRDNWVDVALVIDLHEPINRAAMKGEKFKSILDNGISVMLENISRFRRKAVRD